MILIDNFKRFIDRVEFNLYCRFGKAQSVHIRVADIRDAVEKAYCNWGDSSINSCLIKLYPSLMTVNNGKIVTRKSVRISPTNDFATFLTAAFGGYHQFCPMDSSCDVVDLFNSSEEMICFLKRACPQYNDIVSNLVNYPRMTGSALYIFRMVMLEMMMRNGVTMVTIDYYLD